jgi:hypothetical protein
LQREQAVYVLQDILRNFTGKWIDYFAVTKCYLGCEMGYVVEIKGVMDESAKRRIEEIAEIYGVYVQGENNRIVVFDSKQPESPFCLFPAQ